MTEELIFEKSRPGRRCVPPIPSAPGAPPPEEILPPSLLRKRPAELPQVTELELARHYTRLSTKNAAVTNRFYPLGSCTMKYNPPAILSELDRPENAWLHPLQDEGECQGILEMMKELEEMLGEISGLPQVTLQPAAGAHGELTSLLVIRKALLDRGALDRNVILVPDSAHGTNPASSTMAGFKVRTIRSTAEGRVSLEELKKACGPDTAALMLTNPNTMGLFEKDIARICGIVHEAGGYVYMDGANLNAILGWTRPGDFGVDAMHFNLHKTFATPHGMGGPGAGPIAVTEELEPFLPVPRISGGPKGLFLDWNRPKSIGSVRGFYGNTGVLAMAWTYIRLLGKEGLKRVSSYAVLNANYLLSKVRKFLQVPHGEGCLHEFVATARPLASETGVRALDLAKGLIDKGFHPPTVYFPLIVPEALMIEPTETETKETLDAFAKALESLVREARREGTAPFASRPETTEVSRPDEVRAVKEPRLRWTPGKGD
ncbi:MAG TPA: glycine dehydrogenase subunit 2 [Planctomycetes bacterium]|nr:glycine dehydrogenase subunit 2 [Planctomycetota bacterium]